MSITYFRDDVVQKFKSLEVRRDLKFRIENFVRRIDPDIFVNENSLIAHQDQLIQELSNTNLPLTCGDKFETQLLFLKLQFVNVMVERIKECIIRRNKSKQLDYEEKIYQISPFGAKKEGIPDCGNKKFLMPVAVRDPKYDLDLINSKKETAYYHIV